MSRSLRSAFVWVYLAFIRRLPPRLDILMYLIVNLDYFLDESVAVPEHESKGYSLY